MQAVALSDLSVNAQSNLAIPLTDFNKLLNHPQLTIYLYLPDLPTSVLPGSVTNSMTALRNMSGDNKKQPSCI